MHCHISSFSSCIPDVGCTHITCDVRYIKSIVVIAAGEFVWFSFVNECRSMIRIVC